MKDNEYMPIAEEALIKAERMTQIESMIEDFKQFAIAQTMKSDSALKLQDRFLVLFGLYCATRFPKD